jgi:hypothetical protein
MSKKSKELLEELSLTELQREWQRIEGASIDRHPDNTIRCRICDQSILGDDPEIIVECLDCFISRRKNGVKP